MTDDAMLLPPAGALVQHRVADFEAWLTVFEADEQNRRQAGMLAHHLLRAADDPNDVTIYLALSDLGKAREFAESDDLRAAMEGGGVISAPAITWIEPLHDSVLTDRPLPGALIRSQVADSARWLEMFVANQAVRRSAGIIGEGAARLIDEPNRVVAFLQADTQEALRTFRDSPELRAAMERAGVVGPPEVSYVDGGAAKLYD